MNKTSFLLIALLLPLNASPVHSQSVYQGSSSPKSDVRPLSLPDAPFPQRDFVLPPDPDAGRISAPRTLLSKDREYDLVELIDIAERENPETRVAWERARNVAIGEGMAASTYLPVITANVLGGYQGVNGQNSSLGATVHNSGNVFGNVEAVSVEWLLFDFGGRKNIVGAARKLSYASNIAFIGAHQQVIYAVSIAYYAYLAAIERHRTAMKALANTQEIEAAAEARYTHGQGTVIETAQTRNLTAQARFSVVTTQGAEQQAYAALLAAMGVSPLETIRIAPLIHRSLSTDDLKPVDQIVRDALARRPDVLAGYSTLLASQASVKVAEAQNRPKIFLSGTGAYVSGQLGLTAVPSFGGQLPTLNITGNQWNGTVLVGMSIPVFDAHRRTNAIRQAKNDEDKAAATLDQVRLNAMREIVSAQITLRTSLAANDAALALKAAAQTSYDATLDAYKQGVGTVTASVDAETHLFQAELAEDDAYMSALSAAATIAFATGTLGAAPR
jgi:outer membrane protein TolC